MVDQITLTLPDDMSERVRSIAKSLDKPVEQVLLEHLETLSQSLPSLPPTEQAELDALQHLSDDVLWTIAQEQMPEDVQARAHRLMRDNALQTLSDSEKSELDQLLTRSDRLALRKAEAASILQARGHQFEQADFRKR